MSLGSQILNNSREITLDDIKKITSLPYKKEMNETSFIIDKDKRITNNLIKCSQDLLIFLRHKRSIAEIGDKYYLTYHYKEKGREVFELLDIIDKNTIHSDDINDIYKELMDDNRCVAIHSIIDTAKDLNTIFDKPATPISEIAIHDNSILKLEGAFYKNWRKQKNKVESDIQSGKLSLESYPLNKLPENRFLEILALGKEWMVTRSVPSRLLAPTLTNSKMLLDKRLNDDIYQYFIGGNVTIIYHNDNKEVLTYGIDFLKGKNLIELMEGKFNYKYMKEYPDVNKLINHYEVTNMYNRYKDILDYDKISFTLCEDILRMFKRDYFDFKARMTKTPLVANVSHFLSNKHSKYSYTIKSKKRSIF